MAKHVDNTVSCLTDTSMLFILSRIILVGFYVCIGVVGNGFVLWQEQKSDGASLHQGAGGHRPGGVCGDSATDAAV